MTRTRRILVGLAALVLAATPARAVQPLTALDPVEVYSDGFQDLRGLAVDTAGNVFVADRAAGTVTRIAPDRTTTVVASGLERPIGLAFDLAGRLLIAEEKAARVVRREASGSRTPLVTGIKQPRWLAVRDDGTLYISARRLTRDTDPEPDDESAEPEMVLAVSPSGQLSVFADGFRHLQGLVNHQALWAATRGRQSESQADGVVFQLPIPADGSAGPATTLWPRDAFKMPVGLARDHLGALWLTTKELDLQEDESKSAVAKLHPAGAVSRFAENLAKPQGLAFDAAGNLYVADGTSGRVLRFLAPAPPTLTSPTVTAQSPFTVTGTTAPGARVDVFLNEATTAAATVTAAATGVFSAPITLTPNGANTLEVFATTHGGDGLTSPATEATVIHDDQAPALLFQAPPAGAYVRGLVGVQAQATDAGSQVASLALTVDGQTLTATVTPALPAASATASATWDTTTVADGSHTLGATATDAAGTPATATRVVIVDNTPPDTTITSAPPGEVSVPDVTLGFTGADNFTPIVNLVFAWRLDGGAFTAFSGAPSATLTGLTKGPHTFQVKARDLAGNEDPTPAGVTFTVRFGPAITAVDPASGPIGTFVTITGTNFEPGATTVAFSGLAAGLRSVSATQITTTVPIGATTGPLTVTTSRGSASATFTVTLTGDFTLTAAPAPPTTLRVIAGDQASATITASGSGSFTSLVAVSVAPAVPGVTATFGAPFLASGANTPLAFRLATTVTPGLYAFTVTGEAQVDGRTVTRSAAVTLEVLPPDTHAVTGRIMTAESIPQPIPGVTVTLGTAFTLTDTAGNFVLLAPPVGANMLFVDGRTGSTPAAQFPIVEVNLTVQPAGPSRVPFTIYLPKLDTGNAITLPLDAGGFTTQEVKATTPRIPDLEITIPAGTRIIGPDGNPVSQLVITPVPVDRSPMPFPPGVTFPYLFAINPGGAVPSNPLPLSFPNVEQAPPGSQADLYYFDLAIGNWNVWGTGTVSADGRQIVSDPGFGLPRLAWHSNKLRVPVTEVLRERHAKCCEPIDIVTGRFVVSKTDLMLPARLPIAIQRHYGSSTAVTGLFGRGWNLETYDTRINQTAGLLTLVLPNQSFSRFVSSGPGQWTNANEPFLRGAVLTPLPGDFRWQLRFKDGTVHRFERLLGFANEAALAAITDRNGNTVTLTRVAQAFQNHKITQITEPAGRSFTLAYDAADRIASVTDPIGRVVQYTYDAQGRLETVTDPAGGVTRYAYDASHRMVSITDPRAIPFITNEYDAQGRVIRQTQADGAVWQLVYELTGNLVTQTTMTDPRGHPTSYRFTSEGFTVSVTDALGQTAVNEYAPGSNLLTATTDSLGRTTRFSYDALGNVTSLTNAAGNIYSFTYEPTFNRVTAITDPLGHTRRFEYDAAGNLTATLDRLNQRTTIVSDGLGQPTSLTDPLGQPRQFTYDAAGNVLAIVDPLGNPATHAYDAASRLVSRTDGRGRTTKFVYDALDRVTQVTDPLTGATGFSYDGNGNLVTVTDARGSTIAHTYDSTDRLVARTDPAGAVERFEYDLRGNPVRQTDRKGQVGTFAYDALNRRVAAAYADGTATAVRYDAAGRPVELTDSAGSPVLNAYDSLDRLLAQASGAGTVTYQYDALGRRTGLTVPGQPPIGYAYDAASRVTQIVQGGRAVEVAYDAAGRRTRLTLPNQVSTDYEYDAASRLLALTYRNASGPLGELTYQYDAAGNRLRQGGTFSQTALPGAWTASAPDAANRMASAGNVSLTYDANGSVTSLSDAADLTTFTWDARNRLVGVSGDAGAATFGYDALGRRAVKMVNGALTQYLYDALGIVQELGEGAPIQYLRGPGWDEPLVRDDREFYLAGDLGSIVALTDADGAVTTRYTYDPYGATTASGAGSTNPFQYTGRENDGVAGLYWYRSRPYAPRLQRFLAEDVIGLLGGLNLYRYAANNPITFFDPLGLKVTLYYLPGYVQNGSKSYPHTAILVNGNVYSFYPRSEYRDSRALIGTVPGDIRLNYDNLRREGVESEELDTSDAEDALIEGVLSNLLQAQAAGRRLQYNAFDNGALNCVTFLLHVLRTAGVQVPSAGFQPAWLLPRVRGQEYPGANQTGPIQGP